MQPNKIDEADIQPDYLKCFEYEVIKESEEMPIEIMLDKMNKLLKEMPDRNISKFDRDIL